MPTRASLSNNDAMIGRRFLFDLIFSGGDMGEYILTFVTGKKVKSGVMVMWLQALDIYIL